LYRLTHDISVKVTVLVMSNVVKISVMSSAVLLGLWTTRVDLNDIYLMASQSPPEGTENPDLLCMMTECGQQTFSCLTDRDCFKTLACLLPCGDNQTCTFKCTTNYENEVFHEMAACNINKAGCIKLKDAEQESTCDMKEQFAVKELTEEQISGTWYIVRGLNPIYDCFPCQIFTFGRNSSETSLYVIMDYQVEKDSGELKDKTVLEDVHQNVPEKQGFLQLSGIQNGLFHSEEWRILERNKDFMIAEYCGTMKNWVYQGAVAFSRNSPVSEKEMLDIETGLGRHGFQSDQFCSPKYVGCSNLRQPGR